MNSTDDKKVYTQPSLIEYGTLTELTTNAIGPVPDLVASGAQS